VSEDNILLFKLVNGTDHMGYVVEEVKERDELGGAVGPTLVYVFRKLRTLQYMQQGAEIRIGFQAFLLPAEDANISIRARDMVCIIAAPMKIAEGYRQAVSPIQLAAALPPDTGNRKMIQIKPN
jgi:hypothetical protein